MPVSTRKHLEALREADLLWGDKLQVERDKALAQTQKLYDYEKSKSNKLREQIAEERNLFPTKDELAAAIEKVEATRESGHINSRTFVVAAASAGVGFLGLIAAVIANTHVFG
jgi:CHAD domain-containing protein